MLQSERDMNLVRIGLVMATLGLAGCGGITSPSTSTRPSAPAPPPAADPVSQPAGLQPTVTAVSPNVVSTAGTWGTITGTQFVPGATVKIGGAAVWATFQDSTTLRFPNSGAHAAGRVDVTVTNPGGMPGTLPRGYTYAAAESFDANGEWIAHADGHNEFLTDMRFTIRNNMLVSLSCGTLVTMPTALSAQSGGFSFSGPDGLTMSGMLVSTTTSQGQVNAPGCGDGRWWADKVQPPQS
jgi:IPT/TIG domain